MPFGDLIYLLFKTAPSNERLKEFWQKKREKKKSQKRIWKPFSNLTFSSHSAKFSIPSSTPPSKIIGLSFWNGYFASAPNRTFNNSQIITQKEFSIPSSSPFLPYISNYQRISGLTLPINLWGFTSEYYFLKE